jgi:hypothetical protein
MDYDKQEKFVFEYDELKHVAKWAWIRGCICGAVGMFAVCVLLGFLLP